MLIVGIDPGVSGAIALFGRDGVADVGDLPTVQRGKSGNKQQINGYLLAKMLTETIEPVTEVYLELVRGLPRRTGGGSSMGAASAFNFGETFGCIRGVLEALGLTYTFVPPERWKRAAGLLGAQKDASRTRALQLFPKLADRLARKKDVGRAEALLIAHFGPKLTDGPDPFR